MLEPTPAPLPDLVVRVLPDKVRSLRRIERGMRWGLALWYTFIGLVFIGLGVWQYSSAVASAVRSDRSADWALPGLALLVLFGTALLVMSGFSMGAITLRRSYWTGADTPPVALTLSSDGVELALPEGVDLGLPAGTTTIAVPWASVASVRRRNRLLVIDVAPGVLPKRMRNTARYGLPVLDQDVETILTAARLLRERALPGVAVG